MSVRSITQKFQSLEELNPSVPGVTVRSFQAVTDLLELLHEADVTQHERRLLHSILATRAWQLSEVVRSSSRYRSPDVINDDMGLDIPAYVRCFTKFGDTERQSKLEAILTSNINEFGLTRALSLLTNQRVIELQGEELFKTTRLPVNDRIAIKSLIIGSDENFLSRMTESESMLFHKLYHSYEPDTQVYYSQEHELLPELSDWKKLNDLVADLYGSEKISYRFDGSSPFWLVYLKGTQHLHFNLVSLFSDFGASAEAKSTLERYQSSKITSKQGGITFELQGRVDRDFLSWAYGQTAGGFGPIPDIEILYTLPLPSGETYSFILKPGANFTLKPKVDYSHYSDDDLVVISNLEHNFRYRDSESPRQSAEKSMAFLHSLDMDHFTDRQREILEDQSKISNPAEILDLQQTYNKMVWRKLTEIGKKSASVSLAENPSINLSDDEEVKSIFDLCLERLAAAPDRQNPERYTLTSESRRLFHETYLPIVREACCGNEISAEHLESLKKRGYLGPESGYPLPLEHMVMDFATDFYMKRKFEELRSSKGRKTPALVGRSYSDRKNIYPLEDLSRLLQAEKGARFTEACVMDSYTDTQETIQGLSTIKSLNTEITDHVIERLRKEPLIIQPDGKLRATLKELLEQLDIDLAKLEAIRSELIAERGEAIKLIATSQNEGLSREKKRELAIHKREEYDDVFRNLEQAIITAKYGFLMNVRVTDDDLRSVITKHLLHVSDFRVAKFIYVVHLNESVSISPERLDEPGHRRTHSELAQGKNILGAGQLIFQQFHKVYSNLDKWLEFNRKIENGYQFPWRLKELDNGTGHYMTPSDSLNFAANLVLPKIEALGLKTAGARLINRLIPGLRMHGAGNYWSIQ